MSDAPVTSRNQTVWRSTLASSTVSETPSDGTHCAGMPGAVRSGRTAPVARLTCSAVQSPLTAGLQPTIAEVESRTSRDPELLRFRTLAAAGATGLITPAASTVQSLPEPSLAITT